MLSAARECCAIAAAWQGMNAMQADGNARAAALSGLSPGNPCPEVHAQSSVICRTREANLLSPSAFVRLWMESCVWLWVPVFETDTHQLEGVQRRSHKKAQRSRKL